VLLSSTTLNRAHPCLSLLPLPHCSARSMWTLPPPHRPRARPRLYRTDASPRAPIGSDLRHCTCVPPALHTCTPLTIDPEPLAGCRSPRQVTALCAIVEHVGSGPPSSSSDLGAVRRGEDGYGLEEVPFCSSLRRWMPCTAAPPFGSGRGITVSTPLSAVCFLGIAIGTDIFL
jgi:hypothetical protein